MEKVEADSSEVIGMKERTGQTQKGEAVEER